MADATLEILQLLDASAIYLRTVASQQLDIAAVLRIERVAAARRRDILGALHAKGALPATFSDAELPDDATDELLSFAAPPTGVAARPLDDGYEGTADDLNVLTSEEADADDHDARFVDGPNPSELIGDDDALVAHEDEGEEPVADDATPVNAKQPALVQGFEQPSYLEYDDSPTGDNGHDTLVPEDDDLPEYLRGVSQQAPAARAATPRVAKTLPMDLSDVGEDALVTMDGPAAPLSDFDDAPASAPFGRRVESDFGDDGQDEEGAAEEGEVTVHRARSAPAVEEFDLIPDLDDQPVAFDEEVETQVRRAGVPLRNLVDHVHDDPSEIEVVVDRGAISEPTPPPPTARAAAVAGVSAGGAAIAIGAGAASARADVTAGLYGSPNVPTIRDRDEPKPRAAAVQINAATGTGKIIGLEEEDEPLEIGAIEDYDDDFDESEYDEMEEGGGFSLKTQAYEAVEDDDDEYEDDDDDADDAAPAPMPAPPKPVFQAPTATEMRALFDKARAATDEGQLQDAADLWSDLLDIDPDNVDAIVARGRIYLDLGDYVRAMSDFVLADDLAPNSPEPQIAVGDLHFARKDYKKAIDSFNDALGIKPDHAMAFCRRGISHYYRKSYAEAMSDLERAQKLDPDIPNIRTYVAMAKKKIKK